MTKPARPAKAPARYAESLLILAIYLQAARAALVLPHFGRGYITWARCGSRP